MPKTTNTNSSVNPILPPLPKGQDKDKFCEALQAFLSQAVTGAIMAYIKGVGAPTESTCDNAVNQVLGYFSKMYLNSCWHAYGRRDDQFIVSSFDKILSYQLIKGKSCLVHWIDNLCCTAFSLDITHQIMRELGSIRSDNDKRIYVLATMETIFKTILLENKNSITCVGGERCEDEYDGGDFYEFKVVNEDDDDNDNDNDDNECDHYESDNSDSCEEYDDESDNSESVE